jgi:ATP-dependent helicase HrpA
VGRIGHTQPRRIAARSLAARIAAELGCETGTAVGYKVRFSDRVSPETHIKLMTDGILLAEIQNDRYLQAYDTLIIDEAHERSLNIDFLLGYLKGLLAKRRDLKLIITSATIDPARFSKHFDQAPILEVSGRTFPVDVHYRPLESEAGERDEAMQQAIVKAVDELSVHGPGDILVFLSGEREIRETAESLRKHRMPATEALPLYARLGPSDQARVFKPHAGRRIVLATNVAETSLTVPGIHYVIDTGYARISQYSHRSKVQRLPVEKVSRASADQRKGRCGRVSAGVCIRLYSEADFESRLEYTAPEIMRTNLASVILQMKALGFGEIESFPFVDAPDRRMISDGYHLLVEIGAVGADHRLTRLGRQLARLPVDPRIARMLLSGARSQCLREVLVIAAALSVQDPRDRPLDAQQAADDKHAAFLDEDSDFLAYVKLWKFLEEQRRHLTRNKFRKLCRSRFLSYNRVQEWHDTHRQLRGLLHEMGYRDNKADAGYGEIHRALLTGLLSNIGFRSDEQHYLGARNSRFWIFPGSGLHKTRPKWVMAAERVETTRDYARGVARIQADWVEAAAGHLVKHSYSEPHWEKNRGQVAAYDKISLYGLTLIPRRKVNYGPIDPVEAREIFIRFALVEGDFTTRASFFRHNHELIDYVEHLEHKSRRRDLLVDEETLYGYYDKRVPEGIYSSPGFEQWLREAANKHPKLLHMRLEDLMHSQAAEFSDDQYPDVLAFGATRLPLEYHFDPGHKSDGVTLRIPLEAINQVSGERCEWLVPGLLRERVIALMRGLPKHHRRSFVPIPDYADACLKEMAPGDKPLTRALAEQLKRLTGAYIPEDAWRPEELPDHLRMNFRLLDETGRRIADGRDLVRLRQEYGGKAKTSFGRLPASGLERDSITDWDFGELPETVAVERGGVTLPGFPALADKGDRVSIEVLDSRLNADQSTRQGLRRLFMLKLAKETRYLRKNLPGLNRIRLQYARVPEAPEGLVQNGARDIEDELINLIVQITFIEGKPEVRDAATFQRRIDAEKGALMTVAGETCALVGGILDQYQNLRKALYASTQANWTASLRDMKQQLDRLVFRGFPRATPYTALKHFPRYLKAMHMRLDKLTYAAVRDQQLLAQLHTLYDQWRTREEKYRQQGKQDPRIDELRWTFEELRVSLFAQELKTAYPVSLKRIEKRWQELGL